MRVIVVGLVLSVAALQASQLRADGKIDFARDIRPILSDACFTCHGPDPENRQADLRLDTRDGALGDRAAVAAFVAGKPAESEAYLRMIADDPEVRMPPAASAKKPTAEQIELVRRWIDEGAPWSNHWAFAAPVRSEPPAVAADDAGLTTLDRFVVARLEREGLSLSPEADRPTLIRRLSLDLIGLPPTIAEVDAFLADKSPGAYRAVVDRLLASPHYGERWARPWLDAARYADSDGYEKDKPRFAWAYRDWVIDAINRDLPYDRFIIEQIAGDLLPDPGQDQLVATGFLRNSMINEEGGVDPEQFRMEAMFDRMDAIGKGILGLTIQCAQCHTHKYDPLTHEDYYRMFAFLNNSHESTIAVYAADELRRRADIQRQIRRIEAELQHRHPDWPDRMAAWESTVRDDGPEWTILQSAEDDPSGGQKIERLKDGSYLCQGYAPTRHTVTVTATTSLPTVAAIRLEQLNDPNLPLGGPGRSIHGLSALTEFKARIIPVGRPDQAVAVKFRKATADVNPAERPLDPIFDDKSGKTRVTGPVDYAIDEKNETAWSIDVGPGRSNVPRQAVFQLDEPASFAEGMVVEVGLVQNHGGWNSDDSQNQNLGRFRLAVTGAADAVADPLPADVRAALAIPPSARSEAHVAAIFGHWRTTVPEWREANTKIEELWRRHPVGSSQLVLHERGEPRATFMLARGDFLKPTRQVFPGVPSFLHPFPREAPANRLGFARWLVDRNSPTTARSLVNRIWQAYFGTGLVGTSEDLGSQSEPPSHPELLDWLAVEFMEGRDATPGSAGGETVPWSLKRLHRLIVTSATYRQSSRVSPELLSRDPYNRLLARGPRVRVDAEVVRDVALAASGLLDPRVGGPSVHPPAPAFLFEPPASYGPKTWLEDADGDRYRRSLYTFRFRSVPYPPLQAFDAPSGECSCVRRGRSNTPLQALTTLNEPLFMESARTLADRTLREGGATDADRVAYAFRRCLSRPPTAREATAVLKLLRKQTDRFGTGQDDPWELAAADPEHPPEPPGGTTPVQLAAWTAVSRVLLNLDETITKE
jgi:mono/diheme cytochrome c family protein